MDTSSETSASQEEPAKKSPYEDLSRDDLIKKCKGLLVIAQKAKQSKQELQTEIDQYKEQLAQKAREKAQDGDTIKTMQELIESLTEQKLTYITDLDSANRRRTTVEAQLEENSQKLAECENKIVTLTQKTADLDNEVLSLKRQNKRLLDENEDLIQQLSQLESAADEQRQQLQMLEESVDKALPKEEYQVKIDEMKEIVATLEKNLDLRDEYIKKIDNEKKSLSEQLIEESSKFEAEKDKKDKANLRLKSYHKKLVKCSSSITQLKNTKFVLLKTVKDYSDSIPKWQEEMRKVSKMLNEQFQKITLENISFKEKAVQYENTLTSLMNKNEDLLKENNILKCENQELVEKIQTQSLENSKANNVEHLSLQIRALESEKMILVKEKQAARDSVSELEAQNQKLDADIKNFLVDIRAMENKINILECENRKLIEQHKDKNDKLSAELNDQLKQLQEQFDALKIENTTINDLNNMLKEEVETLKSSIETPNEDGENLSELNVSLQTDIMKLETKLSAYKQENSSLLADMKEMRAKLKELTAASVELEEVKSKMLGYKTENSELLNEMKEVNQVLKERGESISKKEKAIVEMERLIDTLEKDRESIGVAKSEMEQRVKELEEEVKKVTSKSAEQEHQIINAKSELEKLEKTLEEKEAAVCSMQEEIEKLKQQQASANMDAPNEDMSTSTISRAEDQARIKELDETFEDKYTKLRIFALKLKKKANDLTKQLEVSEAEKARLEKLLNENETNAKNVQSIQKELENSLNIIDDQKVRLEKLAKENDQIKKTSDVERKVEKQNIEDLNKKNAFDDKKVKSERKTEDSNEIEKLKAELAKKEAELSSEIEQHKATKESLERAKRDVKKKSVLSLEMEDYERSMKDLTGKMEENKKKIVQMESTIDTQHGTITSLKTQIKLLEEQIRSEENQNRLTREELHEATEAAKEKDNLLRARNDTIAKLEQEIETWKRTHEELQLETARLLAEKEQAVVALSQDKVELSGRLRRAEARCAELQDALRVSGVELEDLKTEFASYKVRAQAVLRQNQTSDHAAEERANAELADLRAQLRDTQQLLTNTQSELEEAQSLLGAERRRGAEAGAEAGRAQQRLARLHADLHKLTQQLESERTQAKVQLETLSQCYKQQMSELEARLERAESERRELERQRDATPRDVVRHDARDKFSPVKEDSEPDMEVSVAMLPREEGEGSEAAPSPPLGKSYAAVGGASRSPVPLDRLLEEGVADDDPASVSLDPHLEIAELRRKLQAQAQRVSHATLLLAESERECARHAQLAELLKTEVRRARGSQHAHNTQYMKNVTLKFLTLPAGDERSRLVPVLHKILDLSSEEVHTLQAIARGQDPSGKSSWGSYLPWSGK